MRKLMSKCRRVVATVGVEILLLAGIGVMDVSAQNNGDTCTCDDASCICLAEGGDWQSGSWDDAGAVASDPFADDGGISVTGGGLS